MSKRKGTVLASLAAIVITVAGVVTAEAGTTTIQGLGQTARTTTGTQLTASHQSAQRGAAELASYTGVSSCNAEANYKISKSAHTLTISSSHNRRLCRAVNVGVGANVYTKPYAVFSKKTLATTLPQNRAWTKTVRYTGGKPVVIKYPSYCGAQVDFYSSYGHISYPKVIKRYGSGNGEATPIYTHLHGTGYSVVYPIVNCQAKPIVKSACPENCNGVATATVSVPAIAGPRSWKKVVYTYVGSKLVKKATVWANRSYTFTVQAADRSKLTVKVQLVGHKGGLQSWASYVYCPRPGTVSITTPTTPCACTSAQYTFKVGAVGTGDKQWAVVYDNGVAVVTLQVGQSKTLTAQPGHLLHAKLYGQSGPVVKAVWDAHLVGA